MNLKKIVIIDHEPLTIRRKQIFLIDELIQQGFEVQFWDCSQLFFPGMVIIDTLKESYLSYCSTLEDVDRHLDKQQISDSVFIVEVLESWGNRHFFRLLADRKCFMVRMELYATSLLPDISFMSKLKSLNSPWKILSVLHSKISIYRYQKYKLKHNIDYSLVVSSGTDPDIDVHINHPDWEKAKEIENVASDLVLGRYAVFIDEYFPLHPDIKYFIHEKNPDDKYYQTVLCDFFSKVEQKFDIQIVIAAHPKADYKTDTFGERKIIKYKSAELIRNAEMVFMHASSALSYVMIFNKPLVILMTNDYQKIRALYYNVQRISQMTGLSIINIEKNSDVKSRRIDASVRDNYIYSYLTNKESEQISNLEIITRCFSYL